MVDETPSLAEHMISIMKDKPASYDKDPEGFTKKMDSYLNDLYGRKTTANDWPFKDTEGQGVSVELKRARVGVDKLTGKEKLEMSLGAVDLSNGQQIVEQCKRVWTKSEGGGLDILNHTLTKHPEYSGKIKIGDTINGAQKDLLGNLNKEQGDFKNTLSVCAQSSDTMIGAYHWANQGFGFKNEGELNKIRGEFQKFAGENGVTLSDKDMKLFTEPCHFASFDTGKKGELKTDKAFKLSPQQIETGSLTGKKGELPLTKEEMETGAAKRMSAHLGKMFLAGNTTWHGTDRTNQPNSESARFATAYKSAKEGAIDVLNEGFRNMMKEKDPTAKNIDTLKKLSGRATSVAKKPVVKKTEMNLDKITTKQRGR